MPADDATTILGRADFFEVCDAEQRRLLAFASERKKFRPGNVIYSAGDIPEGAHVLKFDFVRADAKATTLKAVPLGEVSSLAGSRVVAVAGN